MGDDRAYEILGRADHAGPFFFICEHGSNWVPEVPKPSAEDRALLAEHWGWDIGARDIVRHLLVQLGGQAVVAGFSRLLVDPNRPPDSPSFIVREIDGRVVELNRDLDAAEVCRRKERYFDEYHGAVQRVGEQRSALGAPFHLVAMHSFTPLYLGRPRPMEVGVLFDDYDEDAWHVQEALIREGFDCALNAPYSGKGPEGLIYSAQRHGRALGVKYLELEIRQDLIDTDAKATEVAARLARGLESFFPDAHG